MENTISTYDENDEVYERLFQRFYTGTDSKIDSAASSHWKEFSNFFSVTKQSNGKYSLNGYGFGGQDAMGKKDKIFAFLGNTLQYLWLKNLGLLKDVIVGYKTVGKMGLPFSQDAFRQVCTLHLIKQKLKNVLLPKKILVIGDGPGILSALLHTQFPNAQIILADLGQVLFFQSYQLRKAFPDTPQWIADEDSSTLGNTGFVFCPADHIDSIPAGQIDLASQSFQHLNGVVLVGIDAQVASDLQRAFHNFLRRHLRV